MSELAFASLKTVDPLVGRVSGKGWPRIVAVLVVLALSLPLPAQGAVVLPNNAGPCVKWAAEDVEQALKTAGLRPDQAKIELASEPGKDLGPEGFSLAVRGGAVTIAGGDDAGSMYGLLELAEQIANAGAASDWADLAAKLVPTRQRPFIGFRASNPFIHTRPQLLLDDVEMWKRYIDMLARDRFNVLDIHGGYDPFTCLFPNLYPLLVHLKEYDAVGNREQQAKNLRNFRQIVIYAKNRGMKVALMNYEAGSNNAPAAHLADYTAKAVAALLREVPELDMLGFRIGESGQPEKFYEEAYLRGFADSGRNDVRLYTRTWLAQQPALEAIARAAGGRLDIEIKYNGEQLGLPYHAIHGGWGSYSYEGYVRNAAPYRIIWQVRANGTHRYWAWENTEFIRRCVGTFPFGRAAGFTVEPFISYYPVKAATYYARAEDQGVYDYIWEKHWMSFFAWGRLSYDPQLPEATIVAAFRRRFGPAGQQIYQAMQASGRIVPLALAYRFQGPDHRDHSPETEIGYPRRKAGVLEFAENKPMDSRNFVGIKEFVANKIAHKADGRIGPEHVACLLSAAAAQTRKTAEGIQVPPGRAADEWRLLKTDVLAAAALGEYYAARIRGTMHLAYATQTGSAADHRQAVRLLAESRDAWARLADTTDPVYAPLNNPLRGQRDFKWRPLLKVLEQIDAGVASEFSGRPLEFTAAEKGQPTGMDVTDVRHQIDPPGSVRITCKASAPAGVRKVLLWYKPLPSGAAWKSAAMSGERELSAQVPLTAQGLLYQIEVQDESGQAAIFPPALQATPYWVIAPSDLVGRRLPGIVFTVNGKSASVPAGQRRLRFSATDPQQAIAWQEQARKKLLDLFKVSDLVRADLGGPDGKPRLDFHVVVKRVIQATGGKFTRYDLVINTTPTRRIPVLLTIPVGGGRFPAVVCIGGHGSTRHDPYDPAGPYRGFALALANRGYVTIATEVSQHDIYEKDRTLMGERFWDLMRCVSYLTTRPEVDSSRIGCAGLSLGAEMAMFLAAADTRVRVAVISGGLSTVAALQAGDYCPCWNFPGLLENFDWPDFFCMIAPWPMMTQNGEKEDRGCPCYLPEWAQPAFQDEVLPCYRVFGKQQQAVLRIHPGGHVFEVPTAVAFLDKALEAK